MRVDDDAFTAFGSHGQRIAGEFSVDQLSAIRETIRYGKWKNAKAIETLHAESWYNSHSVSISLGDRQREHEQHKFHGPRCKWVERFFVHEDPLSDGIRHRFLRPREGRR